MANNIYRSMELFKSGCYVEGLQDIAQAIKVILSTQRGSVANYPYFGIDYHMFIDKPIDIIKMSFVSAISDAISIFEPRVRLIKVEVECYESIFKVCLIWQPINSDIHYKQKIDLVRA